MTNAFGTSDPANLGLHQNKPHWDALPSPDPLRLRYRVALAEIIRETVRQKRPIEAASLRALARDVVAPADLDAVIAMALNELFQLHEGNIVRFGLRLSEFRSWRHQP